MANVRLQPYPLHLLPLNYPIFTCVDLYPDPQYCCLKWVRYFNRSIEILPQYFFVLTSVEFYDSVVFVVEIILRNYSPNIYLRKYSEPLDEHANFLIPVPGGNDGPSGVLICSENYITYKNLGDQPDIRCPIPRRRNDLDDPERGMIFVCSATHKTKSMFFFLVQTEQGDIFKITLETDEDMVTEIKLKYFDTVPVASGMNVLKTCFLFVASEFGNHYLYQIAHLGKNLVIFVCCL